jgi:hypothetical protein
MPHAFTASLQVRIHLGWQSNGNENKISGQQRGVPLGEVGSDADVNHKGIFVRSGSRLRCALQRTT